MSKHSPMMVSYLKRGKRKTLNIPLAVYVASLTGKRPADYLSDRIKSMAIKINPALNRAAK